MPLYTSLASLSQTAGANAADGSVDPPSTVDNNMNLLASFIAQLRDGVGFTGQLGLKNRVMNGNFAINQRLVSGTVTLAAGAYGHDRWKAGASGCTYTFTTSGIDTTINISSGSLQQVIEGANIDGGTYVMSWTGTSQGKIGAGSYSATGVTGSGTAGANLTIEFSTGTFTKVQLEPGSSVSAFERRPIGYELQLCQRYYEEIDGSGTFSATGKAFPANNYAAGNPPVCYVPYKVTKRVAPTIAFPTGTGNVRYISTAGVFTGNNPAGYVNGVDGFTLSCSSLPGVAAYGWMDNFGRIQISAEL